jgi:hypothetical protein
MSKEERRNELTRPIGYAVAGFASKPVGSTFWVDGELFYKFSQTEAVRFEDAYRWDSDTGRITQQHNTDMNHVEKGMKDE